MLREKVSGPAAFAAWALVSFCACGEAAAGVIIDSFSGPAGGQVAVDRVVDGQAVSNVLAGQTVLGGSRELFADKSGPSRGRPGVTVSANEYDGDLFSFDQYAASAIGSGRLIYDGAANGTLNKAGLGGFDLTEKGVNTGLLFTDLTVVGQGLTVTVNLFDSLGGLFTSGPISLEDGYSGDFFLPYVSFTGSSLAPGKTGAIELLFSGTRAGGDLSFDALSSTRKPGEELATPVVPEPGTLALLSIGAAGMTIGAWRRRNRRPRD